MKRNTIAEAATRVATSAGKAHALKHKPIVWETGSLSMTRAQQLEKFGFYPVPPLMQGSSAQDLNTQLALLKLKYQSAPRLVSQKLHLQDHVWWKFVYWTGAALSGIGALALTVGLAVYMQRDMYLKQVDSMVSQIKNQAHVAKKEPK